MAVWVVSLFTMKFSSHRVSPAIELQGIRSLQRVGKDLCPP
jgi:hypothetical protein